MNAVSQARLTGSYLQIPLNDLNGSPILMCKKSSKQHASVKLTIPSRRKLFCLLRSPFPENSQNSLAMVAGVARTIYRHVAEALVKQMLELQTHTPKSAQKWTDVLIDDRS